MINYSDPAEYERFAKQMEDFAQGLAESRVSAYDNLNVRNPRIKIVAVSALQDQARRLRKFAENLAPEVEYNIVVGGANYSPPK